MGLLERAEMVRKRGSQVRDAQAHRRSHTQEPQQREQHRALRADAEPGHPVSPGSRQLTTLLDQIYEAVKKKGQMSLREVADTFHVPLAQTEQWARVLDQRGMLELSSALKTPVLRVRATRPASLLSPRLLLLIAGAGLLGLLAVIMLLRFL